MPIVYSQPQFPNQVGSSPFNQSYSTQLNFRQMINEVCGWNPNLDPMQAGRFINNYYRKIINLRDWYGLKVRGQISVPNPYSTGQVTVTNGSTTVAGTGTAWTPSLVGQQFRVSFQYPYQTIVSVNATAQTMVIDMPYAGPSQTSGYMILAAYFALDGNIKRIVWAVNQLMGWPMVVDVNVSTINAWDTWRTYLGWSTHFAIRPPTPSGQYQIEIWPSPFQQQVFPFEAYTQPPDMQLDEDSPVAWINSDLLVTRATADALMWRPKQNTYYDPATALTIAREKKMEFNEALDGMVMADNTLDQQDVTWNYGQEGYGYGYGGGSNFGQSHDI